MNDVDIYSLHLMLKQKKISYSELVSQSAESIKNSKSNCIITSTIDQALEEVKIRDAKGEIPRNPLDGIPYTLKDLFVTKDIRTTAGSLSLYNYIPPYDGFVSKSLRDAGAILVAKVSCDEFGMGSTNENTPFGPVSNPLNPNYVVGGSSGGSAAAIVEGIGKFSIGTDTGGSVRLPANFCGLVGHKPTYGNVSRYGQIAYASSLDQASPMGKTVLDVACIMEKITAKDTHDSTNSDKGAMKIVDTLLSLPSDFLRGKVMGVEKSFVESVSPDVRAQLVEAIKHFEKLGVRIEEITLPHVKYSVSTYYLIATAEASANLARYDGIHYGLRSAQAGKLEDTYVKSRTLGLGTEVKKRIMLGTFALSSGYHDAYFKKASKVRRLIYQDYLEAFKKVNFIFSPVCATSAFSSKNGKLDSFQMYMNDLYTIPVNLAGLPGLAIPFGKCSNNMPTGFQIIGSRFNDEELFKIGHAFQKSLG